MDFDFEPFDIILRDGRQVHVRPLRSSDQEEILQAFDRLSPEARYMRFMSAVKQLDERWLRDALARFPERGVGIAATVPAADGIDIVGAASCVIGADPETCEFAITIVDPYAGGGLGKRLLTTLIEVARRRGLRVMEGFVLASNKPMLKVAKRLGFEIRFDPDDPSVRTVRLELSPKAAEGGPAG